MGHVSLNNKTAKNTVINMTLLGSLLLLMSSAVRVGGSLYLPALPVIGNSLSISDAGMGLTITVYFMVFSLCVLVSGPFSDAFGRRPLILVGGVIFIAGSFVCGMADSFSILLSGRIVQAIGASMIPGTSRAMIRDAGSDTQVMSLLGWMAVLGGLLMVAAPILGGLITEAYGWRYNFWVLVLFSILVMVVMFLRLPETLVDEKRIKLHLVLVLKSYGRMLLSPKFVLVIMPVVCCFAIQGAYLASSPFIFIKSFMLTPTQFGLSNIAIVVALMGGRYLSISMATRYSSRAAYLAGAMIVLVSGVAFTLIAIMEYENIYALLLAIGIFGLGFGTISPVGIRSSITAFRETSGMAAALQGCLAFGGISIGSGFVSWMLKHFSESSPVEVLSFSVIILAVLTFGLAIYAKNDLV